MEIPALHRWPETPKAAIALQKELRERVRVGADDHACVFSGHEGGIGAELRIFAGADVAFSLDGRQVVAGVVLWDRETGEILEQRVRRRPVRFPYVPGLLSFREIPTLLHAFRALERTPEVVLCDGQGFAHPRRCGLASHLGLWLRIPTVGCAKSRLCGEAAEPGPRQGARAALMFEGEQVGYVLRTRDGVKPLYVSPGHLCDFDAACRLTLAACRGFRLPEPTRRAHQLVTRERQRVR